MYTLLHYFVNIPIHIIRIKVWLPGLATMCGIIIIIIYKESISPRNKNFSPNKFHAQIIFVNVFVNIPFHLIKGHLY